MIVVTTPTGNIGRHVVRHLLEAGEALRLIVRDRANLPQEVCDRVDVVEGSHGDADVVDRAFRGADAVFWLCPPPQPSVSPDRARKRCVGTVSRTSWRLLHSAVTRLGKSRPATRLARSTW